MNKRQLFPVLVLAIIAVIAVMMYWKQAQTANESQEPEDLTDAVEYNASYGAICPLDVRFRRSRTAPTIDCACPDGYTFDQTMIGGEECYDGAECPIFAVECVAGAEL